MKVAVITTAVALGFVLFLNVIVYFRDVGANISCSCRPDRWQTSIPDSKARNLRLWVGVVFMICAVASLLFLPLAALVFGLLGITHITAFHRSYPACPELGIIPTLIKGHHVETGCGPWCKVDARFYTNDDMNSRSVENM